MPETVAEVREEPVLVEPNVAKKANSIAKPPRLVYSPASPDASPPPSSKDPVKYGELIVLGYNGSLPNGDRGRRKSRFALYKRPKANGVKPSTVHTTATPQAVKAVSSKEQHSISYTLSRNHTVVVEYTHDADTDMFQIGRSTESPIDFVVMDTVPGSQSSDETQITQSTISRFACRIKCQRTAPYTARIFAAGFDTSKNIFLGVRYHSGLLGLHPRHQLAVGTSSGAATCPLALCPRNKNAFLKIDDAVATPPTIAGAKMPTMQIWPLDIRPAMNLDRERIMSLSKHHNCVKLDRKPFGCFPLVHIQG